MSAIAQQQQPSASESTTTTSNHNSGNENHNQNEPDTWFRRLSHVSSVVLSKIEAIGESVANVLGLNDSKFQYVIDGMDEDDWKRAKEVHEKREIERIAQEQAEAANKPESVEAVPLESVEVTVEDGIALKSIDNNSSNTDNNHTNENNENNNIDNTSTNTTENNNETTDSSISNV